MTRKLRDVSDLDLMRLDGVLMHLKTALDRARFAKATQTVKKIKSAIKSAEGAVRHAERALSARNSK